jgi:plasmid stabilization system protein ParE
MKPVFGPLAVEDLVAARDHYLEIDPELAEGLRAELDRVLERLAMFPNGAPPVQGFPGVRRARMRRFPYGVFYRLDDEQILVLRVLHSKRDVTEL